MTRSVRLLLCLAVVALAALGGGAAYASPSSPSVSYAGIEGSGSTWSQVILQQWIGDVNSLGIRVTYNGSGSSQGRKDFANSVTDFGISEIPYQGTDPVTQQADTSNGRSYAYLPIVAGGTSFTYQLKVGGQLVKNLRLSGETIAKIFTNQITSWNDAQITKDNNGRAFPALPITPVVRSDGSGTTAQFTRYLDTVYPTIWRPYNGQAGLTSQFPRKGRQIAASGSDQVMNTIDGAAGNGTIGYVEYSYPLNAHYPVVKVQNSAGYFVEPTQYNVAVALTKAQINNDANSQQYLTQVLDGVYADKDPRTYPLSSYSYAIIPTGNTDQRMTTAKRQSLADFLFYGLCQGQTKAGPYGYSPLPLNLVQAGFSQIAKLGQADPAVDLTQRDVASCNNPTFVKGNLSANHLAQIAPQPAACDKVGAGPCGTETGTGKPSSDKSAAAAAAGPAATAGPAAAAAPAATTVDPATGAVVAAPPDTTAVAADTPVYANPIELTSAATQDKNLFAWVSVLELLALVMLPGLYVVATKRRRSGGRPMRRYLLGMATFLALVGSALVVPTTATGASGAAVAYSQTKTLTRDWTDTDGTAKTDARDVTVQADRTTDLQARERINISWSGAHPSGGRAANPFGASGLNQEYPVVIMQCRGLDDPSLPQAQQLRPDTCWTGTWPQRTSKLPNVSAAWMHDRYADPATLTRVSGVSALPADCPAVPDDFDAHVTPFAAASGKVYSGCTNETMPPEAAVGSADPPHELSAFTAADGTGSAQFEVRTKAENESLGCTRDVPCSIVVVPIEGISCAPAAPAPAPTATATATDPATATATPTETTTAQADPPATSTTNGDGGCNKAGSFAPGSSNFANDAVDLSVSPYLWWSASNWRNRFSIPLGFALPPSTCQLLSSGTPVTFYGSALLGQATLQWAPSYCLNAKRFNWQANIMPDEAAFSLMTNGGADAALVTGQGKVDGDATKVGYAPTAVSGFGVAFDIDRPDNGGQQTTLKLNARLLAKLLTMSYPASSAGATHPGIESNPLSINLDPEFQELNPGLDATHGSEAASTLLSLSTSSDVIRSITSYIVNDPDAAGFMKGTADPYGMVVNPAYKDLKLPVSTWPILDTFIPSTPGQPCLVANPAPYLPKVAAPVSTFAQISQAMLLSWPNVNTVCDTDPTTGLFKLGRIAPQGVGSRFILGLVTLGDAQRYGLPVAALQAAPGAFVAPSNDSLAAAVQLAAQPALGKPKKGSGNRSGAKVDTVGAYAVDQSKIRGSSTAYPGMLVVSTAARLSGLDKDAAKRVSSFIDISTTEGQVVGRGNGQLPQGYLPIVKSGVTGKLYDAARRVSKLIALQRAPKEKTAGAASASTAVAASPLAPAAPAPAAAPAVVPGVPATVATKLASAKTAQAGAPIGGFLLPLLLFGGITAGVVASLSRLAGKTRQGTGA